jgi:tetratricopeptide (TPR) repeat protein
MAEQEAGYRYDVFISYSQADADWVWDWLLPRLEEAGLEVCIDQGCFEPGKPVLGEVERAITHSRHTLAVLSPDWVESQSNDFEALLVQHQDPAARFRRLIPILLEACQPPKRIQLLHWVDFTRPERHEAQLERIVAAVRGVSTLPELRPERAFPTPEQRRWELRWMTLAGVAALLTLSLLAWWIYSQLRGPSIMPEGHFNIAVAEFDALDEAGAPASGLKGEPGSSDARELASSVASYLNSQAETLVPIIGREVAVWGPEKGLWPVAPDQEAERAGALHADVLVYGTLRKLAGDRWQLEPAFYLTDEAVSRVDELRGEYALGMGIPYRPDSAASKRDASTALQARLKALVQILIGLSYFDYGTLEGYQQAAQAFEGAAQDPDWGAAEDGTGQEVLYLFLGSAYLKQTPFFKDASPDQTQLLQDSLSAFRKAVELNSAYPRAYNGVGGALFHMARPPDWDVEAECDWKWELLSEAADAHNQALSAPPETKSPHAYVDLRARLGLAQLSFWRGYCLPDDWPDAWDTAGTYYQAVLAEYQAHPDDHLDDSAIVAYTYLGHMAYILASAPQAGPAGTRPEGETPPDQGALLDEAIQAYSRVLELADAEEEILHAISLMPYLLDAYCLEGRAEQATSVLDGFLAGREDEQRAREWVMDRVQSFGTCRERSRIR